MKLDKKINDDFNFLWDLKFCLFSENANKHDKLSLFAKYLYFEKRLSFYTIGERYIKLGEIGLIPLINHRQKFDEDLLEIIKPYKNL